MRMRPVVCSRARARFDARAPEGVLDLSRPCSGWVDGLLEPGATAGDTESSPTSGCARAEAKKVEVPKPSVDDTSFHLALESQPTYTSGQAGTVQLVLEARGGYHVNEDYPLRVDLKAPAGGQAHQGFA